ncbi:type II toxin-antitoxin system VapC family toxin [Methylovulum psychrotolerans]|jgi:PIN domain nuclease of toxin-antitoxin system|uniref:PIN domain-containing protein n=1 Tax=Methylovulum psychrotolerans TaxID=1704499 RepID=UPI001BFF2551|nr:type II toxin-antitoxin system VapC family toxin [Methylovulum psychrotolerans]MBT9097911.1 type II toxin-antitoxin system VapC family toxin [Methylovulum psychrotolerans]
MNSILDASALLAWLQEEPGADITQSAILNKAAISTVNWAEVIEKAIAHGINIDNLDDELAELGLSFIDFDRRQAYIAGDLRQKTKTQGLSLGDRACLALAIHLNLPVLTADKIWQQLNIGVSVQLIR